MELVAVPTELSKNSLFDIIIDDEITLKKYCAALLNKIFILPQSNFPAFINYQCNQVNDALKWLNKLEKLIANNEDLFVSKHVLCRYNKLINLIEKKRSEVVSSRIKEPTAKTPKRLINADSEDRHFSFYEVKAHIETLEQFNDKIMYLTEEIFEFRQADIISKNSKLLDYDIQCEQLIVKLQTMRKMKAEFEKEKLLNNPIQSPFNKLKFNGNVNQLVDVFYQLSRELFVDGKSYLDGNTNDIIALIVNSFLDKEGKEISPLTVKTILKPSKEEKRPNTNKRLDIEKFL